MELDTIVAVATAPGRAAVALVRLSGPDAFRIAEALSPGLVEGVEPRSAALRTLRDPADGAPLDRALVTRFPAPASYTGEDVVEFSTHGGPLVSPLVVDAAISLGARAAEPGEFTRRAYLHGRMDLVQAESVLDLVQARSRALHGAALRNLDAGLSARLGRFRAAIVGVEAMLVHHIDFPEEDDAPVPLERIVAKVAEVEESLSVIVATAPEGGLLVEGARVVLAGRPNVGKSSLFNALLGEERAIVTEVEGTTRDYIEAMTAFNGYPIRLVDTAGLRDAGEAVERLGVEMTRRQLEDAQLVLLCVEADRRLESDELELLRGEGATPVLLVRTKADLVGGGGGPRGIESNGVESGGIASCGIESGGIESGGAESGPGGPVPEGGGVSETDGASSPAVFAGNGAGTEVTVSVAAGAGIAELRGRVAEYVFAGLVAGGGADGVLTRPRQARAAGRALEELTGFRTALERGVPAEVAGAHLRAAETAIEELIGVVGSEEVLDRVFSEFCIGK